MKVYVVDNGGQWTHREWRTLRYLDVEAEIVPNTIPFEKILDADAIVLSGGAPRVGLSGELGNCGEYLRKADFPIMGICAGHQFMARYFGGKCEPAELPEFGRVEISVIEKDEIFKNLPKKMVVWESHNDEVTALPENFELLASSENCRIQAMKHESKPFYGVQFHPEVEHTEYGAQIFHNFLEECK
ncbi:MAG: GMP synthase subunit A [Candidatus Thermoplasmatota archaeon]|nr:GMP synthase subunit A [Candidatus Thermoplasmatota archaeon]